MKINEISQPSDETLLEEFSQDPSGFSAQDLVKIYRTHSADQWEPVSYEDLMEELDQLSDLDSMDEDHGQ